MRTTDKSGFSTFRPGAPHAIRLRMQLAPGPLSVATSWDAVAHGYAATLGPALEPYALEALTRAELDPSAHVLDVACGPGTLTMLAATRVRRVSAVDFSAQMLERLRARVVEGNVRNVDAELMDAAALTFHDASFDGVFCMFGAMCFPDRARSFAEMRRLLRHGRRAVVGTWAAIERRPVMQLVGDVIRELMPQVPAQMVGPMQTIEEAEAELRAVGFRDVVAKNMSSSMHFESPDDYWRIFAEAAAPIALLRRQLGAPAFEELGDRVRARLRELKGDGPLDLEAEAVITVGVR